MVRLWNISWKIVFAQNRFSYAMIIIIEFKFNKIQRNLNNSNFYKSNFHKIRNTYNDILNHKIHSTVDTYFTAHKSPTFFLFTIFQCFYHIDFWFFWNVLNVLMFFYFLIVLIINYLYFASEIKFNMDL